MRRAVQVAVFLSVAAAFVALPAGLTGQEGGGKCDFQATEVTRQAEELIDQAAEADSTTPEVERKLREAVKRIRLALKSNPDDAAAHWLAGRAHLELGEYGKADSMFSRLVEMQPGCRELTHKARYQAWVPLYNQGIRQYRTGRDSAALASFENASLVLEDPRSLNNAANIHMQTGNLEEAEKLYRRSLSVAEDSSQVRAATVNLAEVLRSQGKQAEALKIYQDYIDENPQATIAKINYAVILRTQGRQDSADAILNGLLQRDDLVFDEWFRVGLTLLQSQNYEGAVRAYEQARTHRPYDKETMENLMSSRLGAGQIRPAMALADTLARWYPYQRNLYRSIAKGLDRLGETQRVQEWLKTMEGLEVEIPLIRLVQQGENQYVVRGQVTPRQGYANTRVTLPIEFLDGEGQVMAEKRVTLQLPGLKQRGQFQVRLSTDQPVAGFRYGRVEEAS